MMSTPDRIKWRHHHQANVIFTMKPIAVAKKSKCVLFMDRFQSPTVVQRKFRSFYNTKAAPSVNSIKKWYKVFQECGLMKWNPTGSKPLQDISVRHIQNHFEESPKTSIRQGARGLIFPITCLFNINDLISFKFLINFLFYFCLFWILH